MKAKETTLFAKHLSNLGSLVFLFCGLGFAYWCWREFSARNDSWAGAVCCDVMGNLQGNSQQPSLYGFVAKFLSSYGANGPVPNQYYFLVCSAGLCWVYFCLRERAWAGAVSAICMISLPIIWFTHLRLDVYFLIPNLLISFFIIGQLTDGFLKLWSAPVLSLSLCAAAVYSPRETDCLLLLMVFGSSIFGTIIQHKFKLIRVINILIALVSSALIVDPIFQFSSPEGASYYLSEGALFAQSFESISSYWSHFFWKGSGPLLGALLYGALLYSVRDWQKNASVLFAFLIPLFLLSLIAKKNVYYAYALWPILPILAGICLSKLSKSASIVLGAVWLAISFFVLVTEIKGSPAISEHLSRLSTPSTFGSNFQTSDYGPSLSPQVYPWLPEALEVVGRGLREVDCSESKRIEFNSNSAIISELFVRYWNRYPCVYWRHFPTSGAISEGFLYLSDSSEPQAQSYNKVGHFLVGKHMHTLWIFADER